MELKNRIEILKSEFDQLSDWEEKYKKIIDLGKKLEPLDEALKVEKNLVRGCQSQVWLSASLSDQKKIILKGDSDALIVRGLVALILKVYSDLTPQEILSDSSEFLKLMGFEGHLSPSRTNGLYSMLKQIKNYAIAFDYLIKSQSV